MLMMNLMCGVMTINNARHGGKTYTNSYYLQHGTPLNTKIDLSQKMKTPGLRKSLPRESTDGNHAA